MTQDRTNLLWKELIILIVVLLVVFKTIIIICPTNIAGIVLVVAGGFLFLGNIIFSIVEIFRYFNVDSSRSLHKMARRYIYIILGLTAGASAIAYGLTM